MTATPSPDYFKFFISDIPVSIVITKRKNILLQLRGKKVSMVIKQKPIVLQRFFRNDLIIFLSN